MLALPQPSLASIPKRGIKLRKRTANRASQLVHNRPHKGEVQSYRNPKSLAMMPRNTSLVPPRRENDGEICNR
jgi:hypothetical protein